MYKTLFICLLFFFVTGCETAQIHPISSNSKKNQNLIPIQGISLLGDSLKTISPSEKSIQRYNKRKASYLNDTTNIDAIIWFGRFAAYKGDYLEAIQLFSKGIKLTPKDPRLYRHRAHRYLSSRQYDLALLDLLEAIQLINGKENKIEPDGFPNSMNIPISSLHWNIWFHLGLTYYLQQDFTKALEAYQKSLEVSMNDDNLVASSRWVFMIQQRLGLSEQAWKTIDSIPNFPKIIENFEYNQVCQYFKGNVSIDSLISNENIPVNDAIRYSLACQKLWEGDTLLAQISFEEIIQHGWWVSFGHSAAESDLAKHYK